MYLEDILNYLQFNHNKKTVTLLLYHCFVMWSLCCSSKGNSMTVHYQLFETSLYSLFRVTVSWFCIKAIHLSPLVKDLRYSINEYNFNAGTAVLFFPSAL